MGFGNHTKTTVQFTVCKFGDPDYNPYIVAILKAILFSRDIVIELLTEAMRNIAITMKHAEKYAEEEYLYGLPQGHILDYSGTYTDADIIAAITLDKALTCSINLLSYKIMPVTILDIMIPSLIQERGYVPSTYGNTGIITIHPDESEFDNTLPEYENVTVIPSVNNYSGSGSVFPHIFEFRIIEHEMCEDLLSVKIKYQVSQQIYQTDVRRINYAGEDYYTTNTHMEFTPIGFWYDTMLIPAEYLDIVWNDSYFFANYQELDDAGVVTGDNKIWLYQIASNLHPELSPITTPQSDKFLPTIPLVLKDVDQTSDDQKDTDQYKQATKLLKKINMNYYAIGSVLRGDGQDVPWDNSAHHTKVRDWYYLFFGLDISSHRDEIDYYFFKYFYNLVINGNKYNYSFRYSFINSLRLEYYCDSIVSTVRLGSIGAIGSVTSRTGSYNIYHTTYNRNDETGDYVKEVTSEESSSYIVEKQISAYTIRSIRVNGLRMYNQVYGSHGVNTEYPGKNLIFPIQFGLAESIGFKRRGKIYTGGTTIFINTVIKTKSKWYESGVFKFVLLVIAVVIAIYTQQYYLVGLVASLGVVVGFLVFVMILVLESLIIKTLATWLVKAVGGTIGLILTAVLVIVSIIMGYTDVAYELIGKYVVITAGTIVQIAMAIVSAINNMLMGKAQKIIDEYLEFREELDERWEDLKTTQDLLGNSFDINPLEYAAPARYVICPGESPDSFYQRTLQLADNTFSTIHTQISSQFDRVLEHDKNLPGYLYN